jgi:hypothetical protein
MQQMTEDEHRELLAKVDRLTSQLDRILPVVEKLLRHPMLARFLNK